MRSKGKINEDYRPFSDNVEAHWEVVERILFLYAKLNPGQGYVQGMNEIIGPIYFLFASDRDVSCRGMLKYTGFLKFKRPYFTQLYKTQFGTAFTPITFFCFGVNFLKIAKNYHFLCSCAHKIQYL